jgi:hypothetical protein
MILSGYNYCIMNNVCLYYHIFTLAHFIPKCHMIDWLCMHIHPTYPLVHHMTFAHMYDFKFYTLNCTTLKMLGLKCFKKLQDIVNHWIFPGIIIYFNIFVSELMKALWEKQNMYPSFAFKQNKLSHLIPWIFMQMRWPNLLLQLNLQKLCATKQ